MRNGGEILGAIDVGTNAVRLALARVLPDGSLETLHRARDPIRPGEGVFATGSMAPEVADRLVATLRRYAARCRRHGARVRAVATSALREARNGPHVLRRVRAETGLDLEVVSGREEARLICLGVLHGRPARSRSLVVDIGGGSTEVAAARGEEPTSLWSVALGAVRLTETFGTAGRVPAARLALVRDHAEEALRQVLPRRFAHPRLALGSSGTIRAVVAFAAPGRDTASAEEISRALERLAAMGVGERRRHFERRRAEIIVAGAVVLEATLRHLRLAGVTAVETGLRDGLLLDLLQRGAAVGPRPATAAIAPRSARGATSGPGSA